MLSRLGPEVELQTGDFSMLISRGLGGDCGSLVRSLLHRRVGCVSKLPTKYREASGEVNVGKERCRPGVLGLLCVLGGQRRCVCDEGEGGAGRWCWTWCRLSTPSHAGSLSRRGWSGHGQLYM